MVFEQPCPLKGMAGFTVGYQNSEIVMLREVFSTNLKSLTQAL